MSNLLADAESLVSDARSSYLSQLVTIRRGGKSTTGVAATKGGDLTELDTEFGILRIVGTTWFIKKSLYVFGGVECEPTKNDVIVAANGAEYRILPTSGEKESRASGPQGLDWRIFTKRESLPD